MRSPGCPVARTKSCAVRFAEPDGHRPFGPGSLKQSVMAWGVPPLYHDVLSIPGTAPVAVHHFPITLPAVRYPVAEGCVWRALDSPPLHGTRAQFLLSSPLLICAVLL